MTKSDRQTIDKVFILLGVAMAITLLVVGALAWSAYRFADQSVKTELTAQKIFFPPKGSPELDPAEYPTLQQYAGQQVDNGEKAKAYANDFIGAHLKKIADGKTYSEVSTLSKADPTNVALTQQKAALFQGETLRGLLLGDGYAYWQFGQIAMYAALASFIAAAVMAILVLLGLQHLSKSKK